MSQEILTVRGISKLSHSITNFDNLKKLSDIPFSKSIMREIERFYEWYVHHTEQPVIAMEKRHPDAYQDLTYYWADGFDECIEASSEAKKQLCLIFIKAKSALGDLKACTLDAESKLLVNPLIRRLEIILKPSFLKNLKVLTQDLNYATEEFTKMYVEITPRN